MLDMPGRACSLKAYQVSLPICGTHTPRIRVQRILGGLPEL